MSDAIASPPVVRRRPWPLLGVALLVVAMAAVWLSVPDLPRRLLSSTTPAQPPLGDVPIAIGSVGGDLAEREPHTDWSTGPVATASIAKPAPEPPPRGSPTPVLTDDTTAVELLAEAERHYAAMDWDRAASQAGRMAGRPCRPAIAQRADSVARGAVALKRLFKELDHRDELHRNWETHPSLLERDDNGRTELLVPLVSFEDPLVAVLEDPLGWTEGVRASGSPGFFLVKTGSSFNKMHIVPPSRLIRVDQQALATQLGHQLDRTLARINGDAEMRDDPNAWYEAGKFAYRNRLDARVTALLDRAFRLDPDLATTIREGNAGALFGAMVGHMKNGSKQQAAIFMNQIDQHYADTRQGRLARLYYDGRTAELLTAAREPAPGIPAAAAPAAPVAAAAPPDLARARQLCADGSKPYFQAQGMPATDQRNSLYHQAAALLRQAKAAYAQWCDAHPDDTAAAMEMLEAGRMEIAARKYETL